MEFLERRTVVALEHGGDVVIRDLELHFIK